MKSIRSLAIVVVCFLNVATTHAVPTFWYDTATGGIYMMNDTGASLGAFSIFSAGNNIVSDPDRFALIPGATFDPDFPNSYFTYLSFPKTDALPFGIFIGNVIKPGTDPRDLSGLYYPVLVEPIPHEAVNGALTHPEPTAMALTACGAMGFVSLHRRQRRRRD